MSQKKQIKSCTICKIEKPREDFSPRGKGWIHPECKECRNSLHKETRLKTLYGIDKKEYDRLVLLQGGLCTICKELPKEGKLCVDHNHSTGKIRGLLCRQCNAAIGLLKDSILVVDSALAYLKKGELTSYPLIFN